MTLDEILQNLAKDAEHYNTGLSAGIEVFDRFDRDD